MGKSKRRNRPPTSKLSLNEAIGLDISHLNSNPVKTCKLEDELTKSDVTQRPYEPVPIEKVPVDIKRLLNLDLNRSEPIHSKKLHQILQLYSKPSDFSSPRKVGDRSCCECVLCKAKYPKRVAMASFHQSSDSSKLPGIKLAAPGVSCASNAAAATLYAMTKPASEWDGRDMDQIMISGDRLHSRIQKELKLHSGSMLYLEDLIRDVNIYGKDITLKDTEFPMGGNLFLPSDDFPGLDELIKQIDSKGATGMVVRYIGYCIAIINEGDRVFLFDSHQRDKNGMPSKEGLASLYEFNDASHVVPYLRRFLSIFCGTNGSVVVEENETFEYLYLKAKPL